MHALCLSCWPRVHAHASKLLCALLWTCGDCARRASVRKSSDGGGEDGEEAAAAALPLGVVLAANHTAIDASADEAVRAHATRLGALVLVLAGGGGDSCGENTGSAARATLREICSAVSALRAAGSAMERLADKALLLGAPIGRGASAASGGGLEGGEGSTNGTADDDHGARKGTGLPSAAHPAAPASVI